MDFSELGLGPEILRAVAEAGYTRPTPIQEQAIPIVLMGRDVLGCAQTGTGKTASFTLPMIEILAAGRAKARMPRSLILAPTRELATQVAENFDKYGKYHRLNKALIIGGESMGDQMAVLDRGVDVLIATPGRLLDMFERGRILLNDVKILVIDEADRMLDMGFIPDVQRIVGLLPKIRQTLFFSATIGPEIKKLADEFLMNPKAITASPEASAATTVEQFLAVVDDIDKRETLRHIIRVENVKNAFIFCNRKRDVDVLYRSLTKHGFDIVQLHGDMAQSARTEALGKFKSGDARLMVCSDVAARGIDISAVSHVFNFDVPIHAEDYIHRIGRTGRAGLTGKAYTIATPQDGKFVAAIEKLIGVNITLLTVEGVPPLALDMDARRRRKSSDDEGPRRDGKRPSRRRDGSERSEAKAEAPAAKVETARAEPAAERPAAPVVTERAVAERPRTEEGERRPAAGRGDRGERDRSERDRSGRGERGARGGRDQGRRDQSGRRRGRIDELGIGEMLHDDDIVGFGDHAPDFILREVPPIIHTRAAARDEAEEADEADGI